MVEDTVYERVQPGGEGCGGGVGGQGGGGRTRVVVVGVVRARSKT